jgi:hypothetical protein
MRHRHIQPQIVASLNSSPVVLLLGPKRIEKTMLAQSAAEGLGVRCFFDLDHARTAAAIRRNPKRVLNDQPALIVGIERVPGLLKMLVAAVECAAPKTGSLLLVGSVDVANEVVEQTGGLSVVRVLPLSQGERGLAR